ncbi:hypothetical protein H2200_005415 [Cladophialophora chaetospira]|uniref:Sfi1 spindle body domain-containing protein n=1 Tax=Cladophialophora chaetospira TaxID=386627 RepID=A0AA38XBY3_9EURO|nr:hypothetical protein H2200_005415 [Cladophialophora chaetospira]
MTPDELADFASRVASFSSDQIDRLHSLVVGVQEGATATDPTSLVEAWRALESQRGATKVVSGEECLDFIMGVASVDVGTPLPAKFFEILQWANIRLAFSTTSSPPPTPTTMESVDSNDPLWQQAVAVDRQRLAQQVISVWRGAVRERREDFLAREYPEANEAADRRYRNVLARRVIGHWRGHVLRIREMEATADAFRRDHDARRALKAWTLAAREQLLARVRQERAAFKALARWREQTAEIRQMNQVADDHRSRQAAINALSSLSNASTAIRSSESLAVVVYEGNLARKVFDKWLSNLHDNQANEARADAAADFFAAKHAIQRIRARAQARIRQNKIAAARTFVIAVEYVHKWRAAVKAIKHAKYEAAYKQMRSKVKRNIAQAALDTWRAKTKRIQEMNSTADEFRTRKDDDNAKTTAHNAIVTMYNRTEQTQEAERQADLRYNQNLVNRLGIFGENWLQPTRQILANQQIADEYRDTRTASYASGVLRNMRNTTFRVKRLEEDADTLLQRNENKRALTVLQGWRRKVRGPEGDEDAERQPMIPTTPAARRSQLLASTTPAYTPAAGLFAASGRLIEEEAEEDE